MQITISIIIIISINDITSHLWDAISAIVINVAQERERKQFPLHRHSRNLKSCTRSTAASANGVCKQFKENSEMKEKTARQSNAIEN